MKKILQTDLGGQQGCCWCGKPLSAKRERDARSGVALCSKRCRRLHERRQTFLAGLPPFERALATAEPDASFELKVEPLTFDLAPGDRVYSFFHDGLVEGLRGLASVRRIPGTGR